MIYMQNLWFFSNCDTCQAYLKDEKIKEFSDTNVCEKFFSCLNREKCSKERQDSFVKERKDRMDKIFHEHPYDEFRKTVIDEIKLHLNIINVKEVIDPYNYNDCEYVLKMPYNFCYSINFKMLDDCYTLHNWTVQQIGEKLVSNIRQAFLNAILNKQQ